MDMKSRLTDARNNSVVSLKCTNNWILLVLYAFDKYLRASSRKRLFRYKATVQKPVKNAQEVK